MSFFSSSSSSTAVGSTTGEKDIEVADPPSDSVSSLAFSPQADYLAVGSWDNNVCILFLLVDLLLAVYIGYIDIGSNLRGGEQWSDPRQSHVYPPRTRAECLLEQGE